LEPLDFNSVKRILLLIASSHVLSCFISRFYDMLCSLILFCFFQLPGIFKQKRPDIIRNRKYNFVSLPSMLMIREVASLNLGWVTDYAGAVFGFRL
jgi:hypothetical protein